MAHTLHINNMVCDRCVYIVEQELHGLSLPVKQVRIGTAELAQSEPLDASTLTQLRGKLALHGFELVMESAAQLSNQIKALIDQLFQKPNKAQMRVKLSEYLTQALGYHYVHLSRVFRKETGQTINDYYTEVRIRIAKSLLTNNALKISDIAKRLGYANHSYFQLQFKAKTQLTPKQYRLNEGSQC